MNDASTSDWTEVALGQLCEFRRGLTYKKGDEVESDGTPVLRANNIDLATGELDLTDIRYISASVDVPESKMVKAGSLLVCTASGSKKHLGKTALVAEDLEYAFGGFMGLLLPREDVLPGYLQWLFRSDAYWQFINGLSDGANINNLKFSQLAEFKVPLPSLEEQRRIVAVLDEAFEGLARARANAEANLRDASELFESHLEDLFAHPRESWEPRPLESMCERITVGHVGPMANRYVDQGIPFLRSQNVRPFQIDLTDVKFIDKTFHGELRKSALRPGDVAIVRTGYPGTCAVIPEDLMVSNCADLVIATPGPRLDPEYLVLILNSGFGKRHVAGVAVGAAQKHFNVSAAKRSVLPFPPLTEQTALVEAASDLRHRTRELEQSYAAKLAGLDELRQSLLQKAFSGELT